MTDTVSREISKTVRCRCGNPARPNQRNCPECNRVANRKFRENSKKPEDGIVKILRKRLTEISENYRREHEGALSEDKSK